MGREVKRVALDFEWPLHKVWQGFMNPKYDAEKCEECELGYSNEAYRFHQEWYGQVDFDPRSMGSEPFKPEDEHIVAFATRNVDRDPDYYLRVRRNPWDDSGPITSREKAIQRESKRLCDLFNGSWSHHLCQEDVDALWAEDRLYGFKEKPTPRQLNIAYISGFGHDSINNHICIKARCQREGISHQCPVCEGHAEIWPSEEAKEIYESWEETEPPAGEGYQIWETVSEGSPVSPVFETPEELARWMVKNDTSVTKDTTYEGWLKFINGPGWAPSGIITDGVVKSGVNAIAEIT